MWNTLRGRRHPPNGHPWFATNHSRTATHQTATVCNNGHPHSKRLTTIGKHRRDLRQWHHPRHQILFMLVGGIKITGTTIHGTWKSPRFVWPTSESVTATTLFAYR
jgi:hypothetical protein